MLKLPYLQLTGRLRIHHHRSSIAVDVAIVRIVVIVATELAELPSWRRESGKPSDCKHQSAADGMGTKSRARHPENRV